MPNYCPRRKANTQSLAYCNRYIGSRYMNYINITYRSELKNRYAHVYLIIEKEILAIEYIF
jgi:hypothetical protein